MRKTEENKKKMEEELREHRLNRLMYGTASS